MSDWSDSIKLHAAVQVAGIGQARHAIVTSVDPVAHAVRVSMQPDGLESGWIPDSTLAAGSLRIMCPSEIGTQVIVVPVEGDAEHPVVVGRLFDTSTLPALGPMSSKPVQAGEIAIVSQNGAFIHLANDGISLGGTIRVQGDLDVSGDVIAAGISLKTHLHDGIQPGLGMTRPPVYGHG